MYQRNQELALPLNVTPLTCGKQKLVTELVRRMTLDQVVTRRISQLPEVQTH